MTKSVNRLLFVVELFAFVLVQLPNVNVRHFVVECIGLFPSFCIRFAWDL